MATDRQLLDLEVSQRVEGYRFDLLNSANQVIGALQPMTTVSIGNDSSRGIKRTMSNFKMTPADTAAVDVLSDRVRPWMVLGNGSQYPLGVFLWAQAARRRLSYGVSSDGSLGDLGIVLAQPLVASRTIPAGALVTSALAEVANEAGLFDLQLDSSSATVGAPMTYQGGQPSVTYVKVLDDLAGIGGFLSPYFLTTGVLRVRANPDLTTITPTLVYNDGGRVYEDSIVEQNDTLTAPNRYRAVDTAATNAEVYGDYVLPAEYPHSYARRGFYLTKRIEATGLANNDAAAAYAQAYALQDPKAYETVNFASPNDPRHETFDAITFRGETYMELSWAMTLAEGGPMTHTAKRLFLI